MKRQYVYVWKVFVRMGLLGALGWAAIGFVLILFTDMGPIEYYAGLGKQFTGFFEVLGQVIKAF